MRALPAAVVLSMVAHGAAVVWVVHDARARPAQPMPRTAPPASALPAATPPTARADPEAVLELQLLDAIALGALAPDLAAASTTTPVAPTAHDPSRRIATPRGGGGERATDEQLAPPPAAPGDATTRSPLLAMRRLELRELPPGLIDDFLARSRPLEIPDLPGARIQAEIADIRARVRSQREGYNPGADLNRLVELYDLRDRQELRANRDGTYTADKPTFVAQVDHDGSVRIHDKPPRDATDAAMRALGIDPYASEKLRLLDATRDQRVALGREHRSRQLSQSSALMQRNLDRLWATVRDPAARKQALFELWDDCAETGDPALVAGGAAARVLLIEFVRLKLRGADAFTRDELARLNARRTSTAAFDPDDPAQGRVTPSE